MLKMSSVCVRRFGALALRFQSMRARSSSLVLVQSLSVQARTLCAGSPLCQQASSSCQCIDRGKTVEVVVDQVVTSTRDQLAVAACQPLFKHTSLESERVIASGNSISYQNKQKPGRKPSPRSGGLRRGERAAQSRISVTSSSATGLGTSPSSSKRMLYTRCPLRFCSHGHRSAFIVAASRDPRALTLPPCG